MTLPTLAIARLTFHTYVRFRLDHDRHTARPISAGPQEARHSSANGLWVQAQIEPFHEVHRIGEVPGLVLRLMGAPFRGAVVYEIVESEGEVDREPELQNRLREFSETGRSPGPRRAGGDLRGGR